MAAVGEHAPANNDGLQGFSANDWAAPVLTYVFLGLYAGLRPPADMLRRGTVVTVTTAVHRPA